MTTYWKIKIYRKNGKLNGNREQIVFIFPIFRKGLGTQSFLFIPSPRNSEESIIRVYVNFYPHDNRHRETGPPFKEIDYELYLHAAIKVPFFTNGEMKLIRYLFDMLLMSLKETATGSKKLIAKTSFWLSY